MNSFPLFFCPLSSAYDPAEYENLPVSSDIKELFQYITRYTPQTIELEHKLKPFIPDYIPAVGDIDAFIKVGGQGYVWLGVAGRWGVLLGMAGCVWA